MNKKEIFIAAVSAGAIVRDIKDGRYVAAIVKKSSTN